MLDFVISILTSQTEVECVTRLLGISYVINVQDNSSREHPPGQTPGI